MKIREIDNTSIPINTCIRYLRYVSHKCSIFHSTQYINGMYEPTSMYIS